jgi:hypothetical protein
MKYVSRILLLSLFLPSHLYCPSISQEQSEPTPRQKAGDIFIKWAPLVIAAWCAVMTSKMRDSVKGDVKNDSHGQQPTLKAMKQDIEDLTSNSLRLSERIAALELSKPQQQENNNHDAAAARRRRLPTIPSEGELAGLPTAGDVPLNNNDTNANK